MLIDFSILLNNTYSYIGLFLLVFASSIIIVPEIEILVASFAVFVTNLQGLVYLILLVLIASVLGDLTIYFITLRFSDKVEKLMKKFKWYTRGEKKYKLLLNEYGFIFVFLTRFLITGAGIFINYLSGFEKMNKKKFISAVILGQLVSALMFSLIGYIFKDTWTELLNLVQSSLLTFIAAIILIMIVYKIIKHYKKKNIN